METMNFYERLRNEKYTIPEYEMIDYIKENFKNDICLMESGLEFVKSLRKSLAESYVAEYSLLTSKDYEDTLAFGKKILTRDDVFDIIADYSKLILNVDSYTFLDKIADYNDDILFSIMENLRFANLDTFIGLLEDKIKEDQIDKAVGIDASKAVKCNLIIEDPNALCDICRKLQEINYVDAEDNPEDFANILLEKHDLAKEKRIHWANHTKSTLAYFITKILLKGKFTNDYVSKHFIHPEGEDIQRNNAYKNKLGKYDQNITEILEPYLKPDKK